MKVEPVCHSQPSSRQFNFHVLRQSGHRGIRYTIGVWEGSTLRAVCHSANLSRALLALSAELESANAPEVVQQGPLEWDDLRRLVERLRIRADEDCGKAAEQIEELHAQLHRATAEGDINVERLTKLGALIEKAASKSCCIGDPAWMAVAVPDDTWFTLLAAYRGNQVENPVYRELQILREIASISAQTIQEVTALLEKAVPSETLVESVWCLQRILNSAGYRNPQVSLECRGPLVRAMEEAGIGLGNDGKLRVRHPEDSEEMPATGPLVQQILHPAHQTT